MRILLILPYIPYPLDSGGNQAVFTMVDNLRKSHKVSMLLRGGRKEYIAALEHLWPDVEFFVYRGGENMGSWMPLKGRILSYFAGSFARKLNRFFYRYWPARRDMDNMLRIRTLNNLRPADPDYGYCRFVSMISRQGFDMVQTEFSELIGLCYFLPEDTIKVFVHHEIGFVRKKNELDLLPDPTFEDSVRYELGKDREISMLRRYDHIITLTETDRNILSEYIPGERISVSPAVVRIDEALPFRESGAEFVFTGGSDHFPNYDGVNWFCECVLPVMRTKMSGFKVYVVGSWKKKAAKWISARYPEVEFTGFVPDLRRFLNGKITVVPVRIGSGMRMKILDAVWSSSPFVTTTKGVEGQDFTDGKDCIIADTAESFADALVRLSAKADLQRSMADNALRTVSRMYDPASMLSRRLDVYDRIASSAGLAGKKGNPIA